MMKKKRREKREEKSDKGSRIKGNLESIVIKIVFLFNSIAKENLARITSAAGVEWFVQSSSSFAARRSSSSSSSSSVVELSCCCCRHSLRLLAFRPSVGWSPVLLCLALLCLLCPVCPILPSSPLALLLHPSLWLLQDPPSLLWRKWGRAELHSPLHAFLSLPQQYIL